MKSEERRYNNRHRYNRKQQPQQRKRANAVESLASLFDKELKGYSRAQRRADKQDLFDVSVEDRIDEFGDECGRIAKGGQISKGDYNCSGAQHFQEEELRSLYEFLIEKIHGHIKRIKDNEAYFGEVI